MGNAFGHVQRTRHELSQRILSHIDVAIENRQVDLGAAKARDVTLINEKVNDHERRISAREASGR